MNTFLGIDPDMHDMPVAEVDETGKLIRIEIARVSKSLTGREALLAMNEVVKCTYAGDPTVLTVEGQELYQFGESKTKNPKSIMFLATVAGMALQWFSARKYYFPTPQEWKGSVPKQIHQARVLSRMGVEYEKAGTQANGYCYPEELSIGSVTLRQGDWKHAVDAIGLAQYGREQYQAEQARKARIASANED